MLRINREAPMAEVVLIILIVVASAVTGVIRFNIDHSPAWLDGIFLVLVGSCVLVLVSAWSGLTMRFLNQMPSK